MGPASGAMARELVRGNFGAGGLTGGDHNVY